MADTRVSGFASIAQQAIWLARNQSTMMPNGTPNSQATM
jgi:hypothetical protein